MADGELCNLLIVDDEMLIRQGIKHYIHWEREGFRIVGEASNGQEALERIEATKPHIVITDIVMPIMDGEELTRAIKSRYPDIEVVVLSSFGEFDYVRAAFQNGAVDYILKPKLETDELLEVLKRAARRIPSLTFGARPIAGAIDARAIVEKQLAGIDADDAEAAQLAEAFPHEGFLLLGVAWRTREAGEAADAEALRTNAAEALAPHVDLSGVHVFRLDARTHMLLLNAGKDALERALPAIRRWAASEPAAAFAVGEPFANAADIGEAYRNGVKKLLQYRFYFPDRPLLAARELPEPPPKLEPFHLDRFTGDFNRGKFESAFRYLQEHAAAMADRYETDAFEFKSFFGNIVFNVIVLLGNLEYDVKELEQAKYGYFKAIDEAESAADVLDLLARFVEDAKRSIASKSGPQANPNMKMLLDYIAEHYAEPLSLTDVAKRFHFHPSYLSSYFAAHNPEGFAEHVNKVRVEEACKLLARDALPISEISGRVGYSDHSYFCKVFKKITGLSPSQYRRRSKDGSL